MFVIEINFLEARELQKAYLASAVSKAKGLASKSVGGKSTSKQSTKQVKTNKEHLGQKKKEVSNGKTIGKFYDGILLCSIKCVQ